MSRSCKANQSKSGNSPETMPKVTSTSVNVSSWDRLNNEEQFMESMSKFMNESWVAVCQMRERSGLSSQYEMSSSEISKRIEDVSKKLDEKYKEVQALETQKAQLVNKSMSAPGPSGVAGPSSAGSAAPQSPVPQNFQPLASSTPAKIHGYSGNYDMSYSGPTGSSGWPSTTGSSAGSSARRRVQITQNSSGSGCPPSCEGSQSSGQYQNFSSSGASSGQYQNFSTELDYGF